MSIEQSMAEYADTEGVSIEDAKRMAYEHFLKNVKKGPRTRRTDVRIKEVVSQRMAANLEATDPRDKVAITQGWLRNTAKFNHPTTQRFIRESQGMLDQHHKEIGIEDPMNWNKTATKRRKIRDGGVRETNS